eukprot:3815105-Pleurochrysis_carterae.AAC.2
MLRSVSTEEKRTCAQEQCENREGIKQRAQRRINHVVDGGVDAAEGVKKVSDASACGPRDAQNARCDRGPRHGRYHSRRQKRARENKSMAARREASRADSNGVKSEQSCRLEVA